MLTSKWMGERGAISESNQMELILKPFLFHTFLERRIGLVQQRVMWHSKLMSGMTCLILNVVFIFSILKRFFKTNLKHNNPKMEVLLCLNKFEMQRSP